MRFRQIHELLKSQALSEVHVVERYVFVHRDRDHDVCHWSYYFAAASQPDRGNEPAPSYFFWVESSFTQLTGDRTDATNFMGHDAICFQYSVASSGSLTVAARLTSKTFGNH